jgi:hypothetical protein
MKRSKPSSQPKLQLRAETIRQLSERRLREVVGGDSTAICTTGPGIVQTQQQPKP